MIKIIIGFILAFSIGASCRWFDIPVPSPPKLLGALLVVAMSLGYITIDNFISGRHLAKGLTTNEEMSGRSAGEIPSQHAEMLKPK
jgi:XapX domain-containing protein